MGHFIFVLLHLVALIFFAVALFVTVPVHILYSAFGGRQRGQEGPRPETHVHCPDCRELVMNEARKCKHCGASLTPQSEIRARTMPTRPARTTLESLIPRELWKK